MTDLHNPGGTIILSQYQLNCTKMGKLQNEKHVIAFYVFSKTLFANKHGLFSSGLLLLLVFVQVMLLGKLHVPEELGIHTLQLDALLGGRLPGRIPMMFAGLVVIGVILRLCHT